MWRTIKKGNHRSDVLSLGLHYGRTHMSYQVMFDESCMYSLGTVDQYDWNKLFGFSYGWHHKNSVRVGWRFNLATGFIEVSLYIYEDGKRVDIDNQVIKVPLNVKFNITIMKRELGYAMDIPGYGYVLYKTHREIKSTWGYKLNPYFGGTSQTPHDLKIWLKEL